MGTLLLRFAGPVQSWAGYRVSYTQTGTSPVPTKTGVAGFLGACLGLKDYLSLLPDFNLHVRVDKTNPVVTDLQVASTPKDHEQGPLNRALSLANARTSKAPGQLTGSNLPSLANRDFIPHAEFICAIEADNETIAQWASAVRRPVYMPYLGRRSNVPAFPVILGWTLDAPSIALAALPRVIAHDGDERDPVRVYRVTGDYHRNTIGDPTFVAPPTSSRKEQLTWASTHLTK